MRPAASVLLLVLLVGLAVVVLRVGSSQGFPDSHWTVFHFWKDTVGLSEEGANQAAAITRKSFHIPAYGLLGFLAYLALPSRLRSIRMALLIVLAVAVSDELLQSFQPNRGAKVTDVGLDLVGGFLGAALARWFVRRRARDSA